MTARKILLMDRPSFWGAPRQHLVKDLVPEVSEAAHGFEVHYLEGQAALDPGEEAARTMLTRDAIEDAEIVVSFDLGREALMRANKLKWLHFLSAGVDHALYPELVESPITITAGKGSGGIPMAETAMMLMLMFAKNVAHYMDAQREKSWRFRQNGELNGMTVGIIGLGHSGADLARKCKAFHMRTLGLRRTGKPCPDIDEMFTRDRLHEFLGQSDFVAITVPRTPETSGMLGEAELRAMKPTAYLVVTSRGGLAQDVALLRALEEGWIAGAALDGHTVEPLPPDSPFWTAPNTVVTPHMAATGQGGEGRMRAVLLDNLRRYVRGEPLLNQVDKKAGY